MTQFSQTYLCSRVRNNEKFVVLFWCNFKQIHSTHQEIKNV